MSDEQMYEFLSYFDTKNLATRIHCPVIQTNGLQDNVCPPHTNMAPYNNLPEDVEKQVSFNPLLMHAVPNSWWNTYFTFFTQHVSGIQDVQVMPANVDIYNLCGQRITTPRKGQIVIVNGKKVLHKAN